MENFAQRSKRVRAFLEFFKPSLVYDIVPINDVYGPTGWDPNIQALVVSRETLGGATESTPVKRRYCLMNLLKPSQLANAEKL
jgi:phosphopantetheine adenylyltransferase